MIEHYKMAKEPNDRKRLVFKKIQSGEILFAGNKRLKIYGTLRCKSGKRMKTNNRVFFASEKEALDLGYRPCGHCLKQKYEDWKKRRKTNR